MNFQKIENLLKEKRNINIIGINSSNFKLNKIFHISENNLEYSLLAIDLSKNDEDLQINLDKLNEYSNYAKEYKEMNHPNILKYLNDFQIEQYYFIQFESYNTSLQDWIDNQEQQQIDQEIFLRISLEILEATLHLHDNNYILKDFSLNNILIDYNNQIKIVGFEKPKYVESKIIQSSFLDSVKNNELFYLPPDYLKGNLQKCYLGYDADIWSVGICLYSLAGAKATYILKYCKGEEPYQIQYNLDTKINAQLINILQKNPNGKRPSIPYVIQYFKNIQQEKNNDSQDEEACKGSSTLQENDKQELSKSNKNSIDLFYLENLMKGLHEFNINKNDESLIFFEKCLGIDKKIDIPYCYIAKSCAINDHKEKAEENCLRGLELNQKYDFAYHQLGNVKVHLEQYEKAIEIYMKGIEINTKNDILLYNTANSYHSLNKYVEAIQYYKEAVKVNPVDDDYSYNLGVIYFDNLEYDDAIYWYNESLKANPKKDDSLNNIGWIYFQKFKFFNSILYYKKALKINQKDMTYRYNLSRVNYKMNNFDKALKMIKINYNLKYDEFILQKQTKLKSLI